MTNVRDLKAGDLLVVSDSCRADFWALWPDTMRLTQPGVSYALLSSEDVYVFVRLVPRTKMMIVLGKRGLYHVMRGAFHDCLRLEIT